MASANQVTPVPSKNIGHKNWRSPLVESTILFLNSTGLSTGKENAYGQVYRTGRAFVKPYCGRHWPSGKRLQTQVLETNAKVLIDFIRAIPGTRHLCLEEGTHSNWLYEVLSPHVQEIVVAGVTCPRFCYHSRTQTARSIDGASFASGAGGRYPRALWGRTRLCSFVYRSTRTCVSRSV